jgi:RNA polymerase sigma factor (TIGR02999 family)
MTPIEPERSDVTKILEALGRGEPQAARELLPLVYEELRRLAARRLAQESPGPTLQPTALVHEAYLRLVARDTDKPWDGRGHFFAAAAEAMRRILVDRARQKATIKHGGKLERIELGDIATDAETRPEEVLALNAALDELAAHDELAARLISLRYFAGMGHQEAANALGIGRREADRIWASARAWLYQRLTEE